MEKVKRNGWKVAFLVVAALMCSHVIFGDAANWDPPGAPAPTMASLDEIYAAVSTASSGIAEREGYAEPFHYTTIGDYQVIHTVPPGKRLVLLKLFVESGVNWKLSANDTEVLRGDSIGSRYSGGGTSYTWDFPDRCVVFNAGDEVRFSNPGSPCRGELIGYHYDAP
jgi:hypothetical protein